MSSPHEDRSYHLADAITCIQSAHWHLSCTDTAFNGIHPNKVELDLAKQQLRETLNLVSHLAKLEIPR